MHTYDICSLDEMIMIISLTNTLSSSYLFLLFFSSIIILNNACIAGAFLSRQWTIKSLFSIKISYLPVKYRRDFNLRSRLRFTSHYQSLLFFSFIIIDLLTLLIAKYESTQMSNLKQSIFSHCFTLD